MTTPATARFAPVDLSLALVYGPPDLDLAEARPVNGRTFEAAVLRPIDLMPTHGVRFNDEDLAAMAESYDPVGIEAAALNFDHAWDGPAHGWATRVWVADGFLWARFEQLSDEAVAAIESGQWPRRSSELNMKHPATGKPYFRGLALLGAAHPAVYGLPPAKLLSAPRFVLQFDSGDGSPAPLEAPTGGRKEETMSKPATPTPTTPTTPAAPTAAAAAVPETPPATPAAPAAPTPEPQAAALSAQSQELDRLRAENARLAAANETNRRARLEADAQATIARLSDRIPPSATRGGMLAALLVALADQSERLTVRLTAEGGAETTRPAAEALVAVLEALPPIALTASGELAAASTESEPPSDRRTADERKFHARTGLTDERYAELQARYPHAFGAN